MVNPNPPQTWLEERASWWLNACMELIGLNSDGGRTLLLEMDTPHPDHRIAEASLTALICALYANGKSPDDIAVYIRDAFYRRNRPPTPRILLSLVVPVCEKFRRGDLLYYQYWNASSCLADTLLYYSQTLLESGYEGANLEQELEARWQLKNQAYRQEFMEQAKVSVSEEILRNFEDPEDEELRAMSQTFEFRQTVESIMRQNTKDFTGRRYLLRIARCFASATALYQTLESKREESAQGKAQQLLTDLRMLYISLSGSELSLLAPLDEDQEYLFNCISAIRHISYLDLAGINPLPDLIQGQFNCPERLRQYVFHRGGRFLHSIVGPIPSLFVALEDRPLQEITKIGLSDFRDDGRWFLLPISIFDGMEPPMKIEFQYDKRSPEHLLELALIIVTEEARLDVVLIDNKVDRGLEHILTTVIHFDTDYVAELKAITLPMLRDLMGSNPDAFLNTFLYAKMLFDESLLFASCENAKAERLLVEIQGWRNADVTALVYNEERVHIRAAQLDCYDTAIKQILTQGRYDPALMTEAATRSARLRFLEAAARSAGQRKIPTDWHDQLVSLLGSEGGAFLHLTFDDAFRLVGHWASANNDKATFGSVLFHELSLYDLGELVEQWVNAPDNASRSSLLMGITDLLAAGFGSIVRELMPEIGTARRLIISPCGFLELLPFHCVRLGADPAEKLLCDAFEEVLYAPSVLLLQELAALGSVPLQPNLIAAYSPSQKPLAQVGAETAVLTRLFHDTTVLKGKDATAKRVLEEAAISGTLHLACHGAYYFDQPLFSGFWLSPQQLLDPGWLSAAAILKNADFRRVGLAILAACQSGRSHSPFDGIQDYNGLDGIFLARGARSVISGLWEVNDYASLLFTSRLYWELRNGATVARAYAKAVKFLRAGDWLEDKIESAFAALVDEVSPGWRNVVTSSNWDFSNQFFWGAFKCSGLSWLPNTGSQR